MHAISPEENRLAAGLRRFHRTGTNSSKSGWPPSRDVPHIFGPRSPSILDQTEGYQMYLVDGLIVLAIVFFFVLPVTDAKTVRMKLSVLSSLGMPLAMLVVVPHLPH